MTTPVVGLGSQWTRREQIEVKMSFFSPWALRLMIGLHEWPFFGPDSPHEMFLSHLKEGAEEKKDPWLCTCQDVRDSPGLRRSPRSRGRRLPLPPPGLPRQRARIHACMRWHLRHEVGHLPFVSSINWIVPVLPSNTSAPQN